LFGVVLLLFAISLLTNRHDPHPDKRHDH